MKFKTLSLIIVLASLQAGAQTVSKLPLFEEFTSSTCGPCANLNVTLDPLLTSNLMANQTGHSLACIKYQMDWPAPGNDPSFNNDGNIRRGFYGVNSIPAPFLDGTQITNSVATTASTYSTAAQNTTFLNLILFYQITGNTLTVTVITDPKSDYASLCRLHIAVTENYYSYPASVTSQDEYHFVCRKMLPNGTGTLISNFTANDADTLTKSYTFTLGNVAQGNYNLWSDLNNITVVAFVQDPVTKSVLQSTFTNVPGGLGMSEKSPLSSLMLTPNPANDEFNLVFSLSESEFTDIKLFDASGREVKSIHSGTLPSGDYRFNTYVSDLPRGVYMLVLNAEGRLYEKKVIKN